MAQRQLTDQPPAQPAAAAPVLHDACTHTHAHAHAHVHVHMYMHIGTHPVYPFASALLHQSNQTITPVVQLLPNPVMSRNGINSAASYNQLVSHHGWEPRVHVNKRAIKTAIVDVQRNFQASEANWTGLN